MRDRAQCPGVVGDRDLLDRLVGGHVRKIVVALASASITIGGAAQGIQPQGDRQLEQRQADAFLKQMTIPEKIGQLNQHFLTSKSTTIDEGVAAGKYGSFQFMTDPTVIKRIQHVAVEKSRLPISLLFAYHVIHSFRTVFPVPLAMSASWDADLVRHSSTIAAEEASAVGIN